MKKNSNIGVQGWTNGLENKIKAAQASPAQSISKTCPTLHDRVLGCAVSHVGWFTAQNISAGGRFVLCKAGQDLLAGPGAPCSSSYLHVSLTGSKSRGGRSPAPSTPLPCSACLHITQHSYLKHLWGFALCLSKGLCWKAAFISVVFPTVSMLSAVFCGDFNVSAHH